ncbi:MAG: DEAD/DEAH box helicase family protein [Patescibacteria group bacterium]
MNEAETRAEYIDPKLKEAGWGEVEDSKILREHRITEGKIQTGGRRLPAEVADYVLVYKNQKIGVIEAKSDELEVAEGVQQAKDYADKLQIEYTFSTNGRQIYEINLQTGAEKKIDKFPSPEELWKRINAKTSEWTEKFDAVPFEDMSGTKPPRYYQEIAVNRVLEAIADNKQRILLTLATGTGKTYIAFQIAWKLFHSRWNLNRDGGRRPRILFLADRNILANQAFNNFSAFPEDAMIRITPLDIRKKGSVPMNGSVFFTIFQTFMTGPDNSPYYGDYPPDFFDLIIIDECHRGGANDESNWRGILEYFAPAVQLGMTATPRRQGNVDTYEYFGDPVYIYSLKQGINDGFLTPFKVRRIQTTLDEFVYSPDDELIEGEIEEGKVYTEDDFNKIIQIMQREKKRVEIMMSEIDQSEKTIVFCATQEHAAAVRDLINQKKKSKNAHYCVRVTANDGKRGEEFLLDFRDNEKTIPTILTTSQKLSTGVDARNIRNIVLMRPVNSMIEFKQIVGRGTRLYDGKEYFTIYDFVGAYKHFNDPDWDGEPIDETSSEPKITKEKEPTGVVGDTGTEIYEPEPEKRKMAKVKLTDGKERAIQYMASTSYWSADGKPISAEEFLAEIFGELPKLFKDEEELRSIWSNPQTRKKFLLQLAVAGYGLDELENLQNLINAKDSDLYDVLAYVAYTKSPITRQERVDEAQKTIFANINEKQKEFLKFVLDKYIEKGVEELDLDKLSVLINLKYQAIADAEEELGDVVQIRESFIDMQKDLYSVIN